MADKRPPAEGQDKDSVGRSGEDEEAQAFAEKFNISLAMLMKSLYFQDRVWLRLRSEAARYVELDMGVGWTWA